MKDNIKILSNYISDLEMIEMQHCTWLEAFGRRVKHLGSIPNLLDTHKLPKQKKLTLDKESEMTTAIYMNGEFIQVVDVEYCEDAVLINPTQDFMMITTNNHNEAVKFIKCIEGTERWNYLMAYIRVYKRYKNVSNFYLVYLDVRPDQIRILKVKMVLKENKKEKYYEK